MLHRTEGIVLKTTPFGEADLIVTYITLDFGLLKVFAKSPRKIKSRFGSSLEPFTHSRISFWGKEDTTLPRLTQSDIIYPFQSIRNTLNCFLKVSEIAELTMHFIPERDANKSVYSLLLNTLQAIENNQNRTNISYRNTKGNGNNLPESIHNPLCKVIPPHPPIPPLLRGDKRGVKGGREDFKGGKWGLSGADLMITHYKIKFLELMGYAPKLDACGRCGKNGYCFYVSHGSILCEDCAKEMDSPARLLGGVIKLYMNLLTWDITKINRIRPSDMLFSGLSDLIDMHIKYILARPLKSKSFI